MALSLPEIAETAHMGHPDFRVGGKIFATLSPPGQGWAMVKLTPEQQESFVRAEPRSLHAFQWRVFSDSLTSPRDRFYEDAAVCDKTYTPAKAKGV